MSLWASVGARKIQPCQLNWPRHVRAHPRLFFPFALAVRDGAEMRVGLSHRDSLSVCHFYIARCRPGLRSCGLSTKLIRVRSPLRSFEWVMVIHGYGLAFLGTSE